jgi:acyl-coenzyme A synthetase/AMP-(fatty) acid ligase
VIKPSFPQPHHCRCVSFGALVQVKGQGIYAFVTLLEDVEYSEELRKALVNAVRTQVTTHLEKTVGFGNSVQFLGSWGLLSSAEF